MDEVFSTVSDAVRQLIHFFLDGLLGVFFNFDEHLSRLVNSLTESFNIAPRLVSLVILLIGLWMVWRAVRALFGSAFIAAALWGLIGIRLLGWLLG